MNALEAGAGVRSAVAIAEECFVVFAVGAGEVEDLGADEEAFGGYVDTDLFVAAAERLEKDLAGGQVDLDIEIALLAYEIFLLYADRGHDKADAGAADVGGLTLDALRRDVFARSAVNGIGFEPDLDRRGKTATRRDHSFGQSLIKSCYQFS